MKSPQLSAIGEANHEKCRYGTFARQAYRVLECGQEEPFAMPLCGMPAPADLPPWIVRKWCGAVEFARDCAVCPAFSSLEADHD